MMRKKIIKFGRSGAFRRKQNELVKKCVKRINVPESFCYKNVEFHHNEDANKSIECDNAVIRENPVTICENMEHNGESIESDVSNTESISGENVYCAETSNANEMKNRDFSFNKQKFQSSLANWAVSNQIKQEHLRGLLKIWNEYVPLSSLPRDPRTLLETPQNIVISNGYWHHGLRNALCKILRLNNNANMPDELSLKINIDGITISKSSGVECWPILVEVHELSHISPGIVGIYCGVGKPKNLENYLRQFVDELNDYIRNGLDENGRFFNVKLKCFIADSPARALIKST